MLILAHKQINYQPSSPSRKHQLNPDPGTGKLKNLHTQWSTHKMVTGMDSSTKYAQMYVIDIREYLGNSQYLLYADDFKIFREIRNDQQGNAVI